MISVAIDQVNKLAMLLEKKLFMFCRKNLKLMDNLKLPIGMYGGRLESSFHVVVGQASSIRNVGRCIQSSGLNCLV
jgi:cell division protein FtsA